MNQPIVPGIFVTFGVEIRRTVMKIMKTTSLKLFQPATLAALAIITLWGVSIRPAQARYTVTLQEVGTDVVATGSGAIAVNGLPFNQSATGVNPGLRPNGGPPRPLEFEFIYTGPTSSSIDVYVSPTGPTNFGSGGFTSANSGSGNMVGVVTSAYWGNALYVPMGYVSGNELPGMAIYTGKTFANLGVTQGTYVWTWRIAPTQNCTLQIGSTPTPTPTPTASATPTATATATAMPSATPRATPRSRPTPHPRP